ARGGGAVLELDGGTGATRSRVDLPAAANRPARSAPRRCERPSTDGRFVAVVHDGSLSLLELAPSGLALRWTKSTDGGGFADGALVVGGRVFATSLVATTETAVTLEAFDAVRGEPLFRRLIAK